MPSLREDQVRRYARHILLPEIGGLGQARLLAARVRVALGQDPGAEQVALAYLAAAGVGTLELAGELAGPVSAAEAALGILLGPADVGAPRFDAVRARLTAINPDAQITRTPDADADADALAPLPALGIAAPQAQASAEAEPGSFDPAAALADALVRGGARAIHTITRLVAADRAQQKL
ncbi:ThiF family adenylyltransferase [Haliangium ochraceum]|uniref:Dinucleotide-utilizing protein involved in molybdopterin and thiamine biosynthesis family 2-like protein n=1 Tax=Haliangium ochraceum (strain DSM 14365 / JCM 11303 / SMP-2) TaxID=502025 RepID=D0LKV6_HALO1|nr:ThiF family adenylyltransferase [Haliangium ochraceum]ACY16676.1 Dinucleotide-utilizing protein involved in molybdopterin and thiamine biosynthesis family 2-like protein [Haliangium ochraceum DSM 14365]